MTVLKYNKMEVNPFQPGAERRLGYTDNLMITVIDFFDGPQSEPDPPHAHPHEQVSYVVSGELIFFLEDHSEQLGPGDIFLVPPDSPHSIQRLAMQQHRASQTQRCPRAGGLPKSSKLSQPAVAGRVS